MQASKPCIWTAEQSTVLPFTIYCFNLSSANGTDAKLQIRTAQIGARIGTDTASTEPCYHVPHASWPPNRARSGWCLRLSTAFCDSNCLSQPLQGLSLANPASPPGFGHERRHLFLFHWTPTHCIM